MKEGVRIMAIGGISALLGAAGAALVMNAGSPVSTNDRTAIEKIVREYILAHPEILPEAMANLQAREMAKVVNEYRPELETPFEGAWEGAVDADVVLVEFFDYACGYCRAARDDIAKLLAEDKKLKVVYREMPVLGEASYAAAQASLAAAKQGKYMAFHNALFGAGRPDSVSVLAAERKAGLDSAFARKFAKGADATAELAKSAKLQRALNLNGTPSWVVGDKLLIGAVGYDALKQAIAEARKTKK